MTREIRGMLMGAAIVALAAGWFFLREQPARAPAGGGSAITQTAPPKN